MTQISGVLSAIIEMEHELLCLKKKIFIFPFEINIFSLLFSSICFSYFVGNKNHGFGK